MSSTRQNPQSSPLDVADSLEAITRRIAKATAHPIRVRILAALNEEEMGPAGFTRHSPDISLPDAIRQFRRLVDLDCIEQVGRRPGRGRERIYRAVRRALFDSTSWKEVPPAQRAGVSGEVLATYMRRVMAAAAAGTLDRRDERHVTWTALHFDERGWEEVTNAVSDAFYFGLELHADAAVRMQKSAEQPIPVTVAFFLFESPPSTYLPQNPEAQGQKPTADDTFISLRSAKALASALRVRILVELNKRPMSPKLFHEQNDSASLEQIAHEFRRLAQLRCIELVHEKPYRGAAVEHVYRAVQRSLFDEETWKELPPSLRGEITAVTLNTFIERAAEAASAGTLNSRVDRHLSWTGMHYDIQAWTEMLRVLLDLFDFAIQVHEESRERLRGSQGFPVTLSIACFESPLNSELASDESISTLVRERPPSRRR